MFKNQKIIRPTPEEDAAINAGIAADPDTFELTGEHIKKLRPLKIGRPPLENKKVSLTIRYDADLVDKFKASGSRWQTRMNDALRDWLNHNSL